MKLDPRTGAGRSVSSRAYDLIANSWGLGIGLLALFACISYFFLPPSIDGASPAVVKQIEGWAKVYYATYGVAGASILVGLVSRRAQLEALGLTLFIGGLCVNLTAIIATFGFVHSIPGMGGWVAYVLGAAGRLFIITRLVRPRPPAVLEEPKVPLSELVRVAVKR